MLLCFILFVSRFCDALVRELACEHERFARANEAAIVVLACRRDGLLQDSWTARLVAQKFHQRGSAVFSAVLRLPRINESSIKWFQPV